MTGKSVQQVENRAKADARALHLAGVTIEQIQAATGLSRAKVREALRNNGGEDGPELELARLNGIWRKVYADAMGGDPLAQRTALQISARRLALQDQIGRADRPGGSIVEATRAAIDDAVAAGDLDRVRHGAAIAGCLLVAAQLDHPSFPIIDGKFDNVSPGKFLDYCRTLRLTPAEPEKVKTAAPTPEEPRAEGKLYQLQAAAAARRSRA